MALSQEPATRPVQLSVNTSSMPGQTAWLTPRVNGPWRTGIERPPSNTYVPLTFRSSHPSATGKNGIDSPTNKLSKSANDSYKNSGRATTSRPIAFFLIPPTTTPIWPLILSCVQVYTNYPREPG